jgi:hypothetical protein
MVAGISTITAPNTRLHRKFAKEGVMIFESSLGFNNGLVPYFIRGVERVNRYSYRSPRIGQYHGGFFRVFVSYHHRRVANPLPQ